MARGMEPMPVTQVEMISAARKALTGLAGLSRLTYVVDIRAARMQALKVEAVFY